MAFVPDETALNEKENIELNEELKKRITIIIEKINDVHDAILQLQNSTSSILKSVDALLLKENNMINDIIKNNTSEDKLLINSDVKE